MLITPADIGSIVLPNRRSANVALLGVLSRHLPLPAEAWLEAIRRNLKPELFEMNRDAFVFGRNGRQRRGNAEDHHASRQPATRFSRRPPGQ